MSDEQHPSTADDRVDELARSAGAALRRPAPPDGVARVHAGQRRRRTVLAVTAAVAVLVVAAGLVVAFDRGDGEGVVTVSVPVDVTTPPPATTVPAATTPATTTPTTTTPTTTTPATAVTTAPRPPALGWQPRTEPFPTLSYIACCGSNWEGEPSPPVPAGAAEPLAPGIYAARPIAGSGVVDGMLPLEIRPYTRCGELAEFECEGAPPYADNELGVAQLAARTIELPLDEWLRVGVSGNDCVDDRLTPDAQVATGTEVATLLSELDAAYETHVGAPLRAGVDPEQVAADLVADPASGFADPGCPSYAFYTWTPPSGGPTIVTGLTPLAPEAEPRDAVAIDWIRPTAIEIAEDGSVTLYLYGGFLS